MLGTHPFSQGLFPLGPRFELYAMKWGNTEIVPRQNVDLPPMYRIANKYVIMMTRKPAPILGFHNSLLRIIVILRNDVGYLFHFTV
jgi:hypothetical protein